MATVVTLGETPIGAKTRWEWGVRLGFALDQTGIQMAAARHSGRHIKLLDARKEYFPAGEATDRTTFLTTAISEFSGKYAGWNRSAALAVTGPDTVFRTFHVPALNGRAFGAAVQFEAKKQIPFPIRECQFGFRPVCRQTIDAQPKVKVALHAARTTFIQEQLYPFDRADLGITTMYHSHDALGQLLRFLPDFAEDRHYTIITIERQHSELSYFRGSNLEFYHICSVGSSFLARRSDPTIFEYFAEALAGEIQNSLDYYTGQYSSHFSSRIFVAGDLAYSDELIQLLTDRFGFEFVRFPSHELRLSGSERESMAACLPAVAAAVCTARIADLLPKERSAQLRVGRVNRYALAAAIVVLAFLGGTWGSMKQRESHNAARLAAATLEVDGFRNSRLYDTYTMLKQEITAGRSYLEKSKPVTSYYSALLQYLSQVTPASIRLANLDYSGPNEPMNLHMQGKVNPGTIPPEVVLAEYVENLNASPLLDSVVIQQFAKRPEKNGFAMEFTLDMRYRP